MVKISQEKWNFFSKASLVLIGIGCLLWASVIPLTLSYRNSMEAYYVDEDLGFEYVSIPVDSGTSLAGIMVFPQNFSSVNDGSVPAVIHINGINNRKESNLQHAFHFAKLGFCVLMLESRGHGQSEGKGTLYGEEPADMPKVIDFMLDRYSALNQTHVGATGFSYGAGELLIAQTFEERLYACALYHPPVDMSGLIESFGGPELTGDDFFQPPVYGPADADPIASRSASYWCNATNTQNLLLLQGADDNVVKPEDTKEFFDGINGSQQADLQYIVRPGLNHVPNENDPTSRQYAAAWLSHFFFNGSIDITALDNEIQFQPSFEYNPPQAYNANDLIWFGMILIELGCWIQLRLKPAGNKEVQKKEQEDDSPTKQPIEKKNVSLFQDKGFRLEAAVLLTTGLGVGLFSSLIGPSFIFGLLFWIPLVSVSLLIVSRISLSQRVNKSNMMGRNSDEANKSIIDIIVSNSIGILLAVGPIFLGVALHDWRALNTLGVPYWPWKLLLGFYVGVFLLLFTWSNILIEQWVKSRNLLGLIATALLIDLAVGIYLLFVPLPEFLAGYQWILLGSIGLLIVIVGVLVEIVKIIWGKKLVGMLFVAVAIAIPLIFRLHNLFA